MKLEYQLTFSRYWKAYENEDYEIAIDNLNKLIILKNYDPRFFIWKANIYLKIDKLDDTNQNLKAAYNRFKEIKQNIDELDEYDKSIFAEYKFVEAKYHFATGNLIDSIISISDSISLENHIDYKQTKMNIRDSFLDILLENFNEINYNLRKVIYIDDEIPNYIPANIIPFEIKKVSKLKFPPSHPVSGQIYVGHPFKNDLYFPIEDYENYLFESQVMETSYLLKSLGASKIKTEHIIGSTSNLNQSGNLESINNSSKTIGGGAEIYSYGVEGAYKTSDYERINSDFNSNTKSYTGKRINIDGVFKPKNKPFIPQDLMWFEQNEILQSLAKQRLEGGIKSYNIILSTSDIEQLSEKELIKIDEEAQKIIQANAKIKIVNLDFNYDKKTSGSSSSESLINKKKAQHTELRIYVEFAPLEELLSDTTINSKNSNKSKTKKEQSNLMNKEEIEYMEVVKELVESDKINDTSRRILERSRSKLGISEVRASEIENIVLNQTNYTKEELEFLEEIKFCLEDDGVISQEESKFLEKLKNKLNITDKRAKELEKLLIEYHTTKKMDNWLKRKIINFFK